MEKKFSKDIWVLLPTYNEEKNLGNVVSKIAEKLDELKMSYSFLVINDGSIDTTEIVANDLKKYYPIILINHTKNLGIGAVFKHGINYILENDDFSKFLIIMEADGTNDESLIPIIIKKLIKGYDIVIASRYKKGGQYKNFPVFRLFLSKSANLFFRFIFRTLHVKDYTIFQRGYRIQKLRDYNKSKKDLITSSGFLANAEMLINLTSALDIKVSEIPLIYDYKKKKGRSKLKVIENLLEYYKFILKRWF